MVLAFRIFGDFHWPPHPDAVSLSPETASGIIEIHYGEKDGAFRPFLRWTPGKIAEPPGPLPEIHHSIFNATPGDAGEWFKKNVATDCAIWIDKGTKTNNVDWVSFRGAFLIDQYRAPDAGSPEELDLRWPLIRSCEYISGSKVFSALTVGRRGGPRFSLNLHLPLPARRSTLLSGSAVDPSAFPFCSVYEPGSGKFDKILQFTTLVGGWLKGDADPSPAHLPQTSFVFSGNKYPSGASLGTFGFAARGKPSSGGFAVYDGEHKYIEDGQEKILEINAANYWPDNSRPFTEDILKRYGFSVDPAAAKWPRLKAGESTADLSLRFSREDSDRKKPSFIYRIAVSASGSDPKTADDIGKDGNALSLRLQKETGGWVTTAETLYADCKLSWNIPDEKIWDTQDRRWSPKVDIGFHWKNDIPAVENFGDSPAKRTGLDLGLLRHAAHSFSQARNALKAVESGQPQSFFPSLRSRGKQTARFALSGPSLNARYTLNGLIAWGKSAATGDPATPFIRPRLRLTLANRSDLIANSDDTAGMTDNKLVLIASGQTFFSGDSATDVKLVLARDGDWSDAQEDKVADGEPFFASYIVETANAAKAWSGRLASLKFNWAPETTAPKLLEDPKRPEELTATYLRAGGPGVREGMADGAPAIDLKDGRIAASIHLALAVGEVEPVGVDISRLDRSGRPAPLLIPDLETSAGAKGSRYWLGVKETIAPTQDRLIEADIYESAPDAGEQSYVVLSQEPFSLFRYTHRPLSDRGDLGSASVAYYSGDERIWQYRKVADHYHYVLPPQAVGESADKPRRLEIHDLDAGIPDESPDALRPYVHEATDDGTPQKGLKRRAVEFRLTPSTEFWIRPSDVERGYFMPESASHEIFRQRGEYGLGAALAFLRGEFLYGLSVGIDVSRENSISRQARVAEIEALTGRITGPARYADAEKQVNARWNALSRAVARRPERLEIWARDPDSAIDFTPARFADGVTYALRGTALHRPPLEKLEKAEDSALWPKIGHATPADGEANHGNLRTHPQGLSGGALWPVESVNLFNALLERPESSGGTIESIALSPTGGDAAQKAAFLGGIVTVISETRNGHVERQKVEVLGRIGAFWHRAKHVVVYERTVNASAQFAPKRDEDKHNTRSRRPILRKVREYVELLDCERAYPDFAGVAPRCTGFLERLRFNSRTINVDSAWGSEVGDYGWKIPLWNLLSARERAQVYPMPDIAFVSLAEGDGDKPVVSQECLDTDNLFFFSDFRAGTSNTNEWVSRLDIDYCNMPAAKAIASHADAKSAKPDDGGRRRAVSRVLPGIRRFTWRLAPAAQKTAINAGRAGKPVYVGLDSVSFMRAAPAAEATIPDTWSTLLQKAADVPQTGDAIKAIEDLPYWGAGGGNDFPAAVSYSKAVAQLANELNSKNKTGVEAALDALAASWTKENLPTQLKNRLEGAAEKAGVIVNGFLSPFPEITKGDKFCDRLKSDAVGMIRRKEMLICTALSDWIANVEENFPEIGPGDPASGLTKKKAAINAVADSIISHLRPIFADASADIGNAGEGAEKAKAVIATTEAEIESVFMRARQRVEQFSAGYDREKPWSAERRKSFHAGLRGCVANIAADIAAAMGEARQRLAVELNGVSQGVAGHLSKALTAISQFAEEALANVATVQHGLKELVAPLLTAVDDLSPEAGSGILGTCIAKIATAQAAIDAELGSADPLRQKATNVLKALTDAATQAKTLLGETRGLLTKIDSLNEDTLNEFSEIIADLAANAKSLVQTLDGKATSLAELADDFTNAGFGAISAVVGDVWTGVDDQLKELSNWLDGKLLKIGEPVDFLVSSALQQIETVDIALMAEVRAAHAAVASVIDDIGTALSTVQDALGPQQLLETVIRKNIVEPSLETLLSPLNDDLSEVTDPLKAVHDRLTELSATAGTFTRNVSVGALGALDQVSAVCGAVFEGTEKTREYFEQLAGNFEPYANEKLAAYQPLVDRIRAGLADLDKEAAGLLGAVRAFDHSVRGLQNDLSRSAETARMYGERVFDTFSRLDDGGTKALPSNALKLYSAVSSAPELAALKADIDRIRSGFDELSETIDTTEASALFNRLGDELKALGLDMPFDKIGDRLLLKDLKLGNFGGLNFEHLFKGQPIPASVRDAVRVTHDFDKAQARAWVQIDIDARMQGRRTLFSLGVFQVDFVDMHLTGRVRLEASKDQDTVTQTGFSRIGTTIDVVVAGQSMVKFEQFGLNFTREKGLEVEFDPKNIRLNPSFKFIQDFLSTLFPDAAGGLKIVKQDNIPVGVEHAFVIPPMTLNFGTSGVSNISIENHFKLLAFPDFMIANRFNLSSMERPFIFSIFVIGGTGYVQIDAEYRPFDSQLMVSVEAGAGGSAALAFAVGPFAGQVFITLSGVMTYRKMIGKPGGGLSLAVVLVIAGHVEVCGIVSVGITLTLRMSYRDNGEVDGQGSLAVTIRISQFFKISARANVNYKLRGGKSETSVSSGVSGEITDEKLKDKIGKAEQAVKQLQKASN